jgi:phage-related minor tail protein
MATVGDLVVNLMLDRRQFTREAQASRGVLQSLASGLTARVAAVAAGAGATIAAAVGVRSSIEAIQTQLAAERKLAATLAATGNAAGLTAQQIAEYASELQNATNFGDEITVNAAAILATFRNLNGDVFKETIALGQDMASVLGTDLDGAMIQLGKALNDPITGLTALRRVGVSFTEQQREQIKALQESGDLLGAQRVILEELRGEFGGAARAMADPLTQAKNVAGDLAETFGALLLPSVESLAKGFIEVAQEITGSQGTVSDLGKELGRLTAEFIGPAISDLKTIAGDTRIFVSDLRRLASTIENVGQVSATAWPSLSLFKEIFGFLAAPVGGDPQRVFREMAAEGPGIRVLADEVEELAVALDKLAPEDIAWNKFEALVNSTLGPLDQLKIKLREVQQLGFEAGAPPEQIKALQQAIREQSTGIADEIQRVRDEWLKVARGIDEAELSLQRFREAGATKEQLAELERMQDMLRTAKFEAEQAEKAKVDKERQDAESKRMREQSRTGLAPALRSGSAAALNAIATARSGRAEAEAAAARKTEENTRKTVEELKQNRIALDNWRRQMQGGEVLQVAGLAVGGPT